MSLSPFHYSLNGSAFKSTHFNDGLPYIKLYHLNPTGSTLICIYEKSHVHEYETYYLYTCWFILFLTSYKITSYLFENSMFENCGSTVLLFANMSLLKGREGQFLEEIWGSSMLFLLLHFPFLSLAPRNLWHLRAPLLWSSLQALLSSWIHPFF